jgi:hypothetical protein
VITKILWWFVNSRLGQTILLAAGMALAAGATYWYIDDKAYDRGYAEMKAECDAKQSEAKGDLLNDRADQAKAGSEIAGKSADDAQKASADIDTQTERDKEQDHEDFKTGEPVAYGSCVYALPAGVQDRIDAAVRRAND